MAPKKRAASQTNKSRKVQNQHKISFSEKRRIFSTKGLAKLQKVNSHKEHKISQKIKY